MTTRQSARSTAVEPADTSFRDAYNVLQRHAQTLRNQEEPNIDDLLTIVTESVSAYQVCRQRIDAVEEALKAALDGVEGEAPPAAEMRQPTDVPPPAPAAPRSRSRAAAAPPPPPSFDDLDDDVPF